MEHSFWHNCWQKNTIGFHQTHWHPYLEQHFKPLITQAHQHVLVPLCGKSSDMVWLAQHLNVVGAELSEIACNDFFIEQGVAPEKSSVKHGSDVYHRYQKDNITLYQGDFFSLENERLPAFDWIFDRAALVALPESLQVDYANKLKTFIDAGAQLFLISLEFPSAELTGPPFAICLPRVAQLFDGYDIVQLAADELPDKVFAQRQFNVSRLKETLYVISAK